MRRHRHRRCRPARRCCCAARATVRLLLLRRCCWPAAASVLLLRRCWWPAAALWQLLLRRAPPFLLPASAGEEDGLKKNVDINFGLLNLFFLDVEIVCTIFKCLTIFSKC